MDFNALRDRVRAELASKEYGEVGPALSQMGLPPHTWHHWRKHDRLPNAKRVFSVLNYFGMRVVEADQVATAN